MTVLQDILSSYKKRASSEANGNGMPADLAQAASIDEKRKAWQLLIDEKLIEWGRHPEQFEDEDGYKAPTADNLVRATEFVAYCRDHGIAAPLRIAPDGEGGIVFEWKNYPPFYYNVEIHPDGKTEMLIFQDCKLVVRQPIGGE